MYNQFDILYTIKSAFLFACSVSSKTTHLFDVGDYDVNVTWGDFSR